VSHNARSDKVLAQIQHNLRLLRPEGDSFVCLDRIGDDDPGCSAGYGEAPMDGRGGLQVESSASVWATCVTCWPGFHFRGGGACAPDTTDPQCARHTGASMVLRTEPFGSRWIAEGVEGDLTGYARGTLWDPSVQTLAWGGMFFYQELHRYVRVPEQRLVLALSQVRGLRWPEGQLRYTFSEEAGGAVDG